MINFCVDAMLKSFEFFTPISFKSHIKVHNQPLFCCDNSHNRLTTDLLKFLNSFRFGKIKIFVSQPIPVYLPDSRILLMS